MATVQEVAETQGKKEDNEDASDTAGLLETLSVGDGKTEEGKEQEEKPVVAKEDKQAVGEGKEQEEKPVVAKEDKQAVGDHAKPEAENKDEPAS
jgi:Ran-binding protein 1